MNLPFYQPKLVRKASYTDWEAMESEKFGIKFDQPKSSARKRHQVGVDQETQKIKHDSREIMTFSVEFRVIFVVDELY